MNNNHQHSANPKFGLSDQQGTIGETNKNEGNRSFHPPAKRPGSLTEHNLRSSDIEVYATASLNLIQEEQFAEAFKLLLTGQSQLKLTRALGIKDHEDDLERLMAKLLLVYKDDKELFVAEWSLVRACLFHPIDSIECLQACGALTALYARDDIDWSSDLSSAYLEAVSIAKAGKSDL